MDAHQHTASAQADGVEITACLRGGHLLTWTAGGVERLWMSPLSGCGSQAAVRGGVPVLFPQFGLFGDLVKHGFARTCDWRQVEPPGGDGAALAFELTDTGATRARWPHRFHLRLEVAASSQDLDMALTVTNTGSDPFRFTTGLHTYFAVADPQASITGLAGCRAWDGASTAAPQFTAAPPDPMRALDTKDIVIDAVPGPVVLHDAVLGPVSVTAAGFPHMVVWNPGPDHGLPDVAVGGEAGFVCIEPAAVIPVALSAGDSWQGRQRLLLG